MKQTVFAAIFGMMAVSAMAQEVVTTPFNGSFEDATFAVENAIVGEGLVIDFTSHVGEMLNRTGADVGSDVKIFDAADIFLFCSAQVSREVMEVNPMNIAHCPYSIFVADQGGEVVIGHRTYPQGEMQKVQALLDGIVQSALE
ncbi:hypothetical protein ROG8370_00723 [Roseovarius gaetbuli]|uniref:DUF302 domain-containing protein n=1 Tax=Roseovarius gaetbuli TaxID=1356575 RepID=A0A1X6YHQ7_9RHOB|nr:DUF302 domain-containing protein [Roseovarius gaetbuli]SLN21290.1 hypothetical protein ROG8370_00723 [Roseovarius gaetbuli]